VSLPAVEVALGLEARVVRRHVARLEAVGWLGRATGIWGQGSVVWLTAPGLSGVGLGGLEPVRASSAPSATLTAHGVLVAWSAARAERRGRVWRSSRELALERERWEVRVRDERGGRRGLLPDLAVWLKTDAPPIALVVEPGYRRADRQRAILEAWRTAIYFGQYSGVRYDCAGGQVAQRITSLGEKVGLTGRAFLAVAQSTPEQIAAIKPQPPGQDQDQALEPAPDREPAATAPLREPERPVEPPAVIALSAPPESPQAAAEREQRYREIFGIPEPKPRRRWRR
jgi:hypothetical protein